MGRPMRRRELRPLLAAVAVACLRPAAGGASTFACPVYQGTECAGHGTCTQVHAGATCVCEEGFTRSDCALATGCASDCGGAVRGQCIQPSAERRRDNPLAASFCACNAGFAGASCNKAVQSKELGADTLHSAIAVAAALGCDASCSGHGQCLCRGADVVNVTERVRVFDARGRAGTDKVVTQEVRVDQHGVRTESFVTCTCSCHAGFQGELCETATGADCPLACSGHGACGTDGACTCDAGFEGEGCQTVSTICPSSCSGHGTCVAVAGSTKGLCSCAATYSGAACDTWTPAGPPASLIAAAAVAALAPQIQSNATSNATGAAVVPTGASAAAAAAVASAGGVPASSATSSGSWPHYAFVAQAAQAAAQAVRGELGVGEQSASACPNGCSGHGLCDAAGVCACADGFQGAACDALTFACESNCSGAWLRSGWRQLLCWLLPPASPTIPRPLGLPHA